MRAFKCKMCGDCCYGEGGIIVDDEEVENISCFLKITSEAFVSRFCEDRHGDTHIKTGQDGFCIFFDREKACLIHPVKPEICMLWPYYPAIVNDEETWNMTKTACRGINRDCPFEEFVEQARQNEKAAETTD